MKSQLKKIVTKTVNFGSPNLTKPKKKCRNTKKCHDIFTKPLFLTMVGPDMIFYYFVLE